MLVTELAETVGSGIAKTGWTIGIRLTVAITAIITLLRCNFSLFRKPLLPLLEAPSNCNVL